MAEELPELVEETDQRPRTPHEELLAFMRTERWIMLALLLGATGAAIYFFVQWSKRQNTPPVSGLNGFGYPGLPPTNGAFYPIQIINQLPPPYLQGPAVPRQIASQVAPLQKPEDSYCDRCDRIGCQCY